MLTGGLLAYVGYALQPFVDAGRVPTTFPVIAADDITQRKPAKWIVRTGWTTSQPMHPFGEWVVEEHQVQARGHHRHGLRLRLGDGGRLPAQLRGERRADRAEALDAAQHQRLQPVPGPDPPRYRRGAGALRRAPGAAVHEAVPGGGAQGQAAAAGRRHHHRRVGAAADGRRGHRRDHPAPLLGSDRHAAEQEVRRGVRGQGGQDLVLLLGGDLHGHALDRGGHQGGRRQGRGPGRAAEPRFEKSRSRTPRAGRSRWTQWTTRCRTSM